MNKFLKNIILFVGLLLLLIVIPSIFAFYTIRSADLSLSDNKHVLVLGHSHAECAINDGILVDYFNAAQSNENERIQYQKLQAFHKANPQIDTVIVPLFIETCSKNNVSQELDALIDNGYIEKAVRFCDIDDWKYLLTKPIIYKMLAQLPYENIKTTLYALLGENPNFSQIRSGGYMHLEREKLSDDIEIRSKAPKFNSKLEIRENLENMVNYCKYNNLTLILMEYPIYKQGDFYDVIAYEQFKNDSLKNTLIANYADFSLPENAYGDVRHINYKGAELFSNELRNNGIKIDNNE